VNYLQPLWEEKRNMSENLVISMYAYVDGKFESLIEFSRDFPKFLNSIAAQKQVQLEGKLYKLVSDDEMSRKYSSFTDFKPIHLHQVIQSDAIFDRAGTMIKTIGGIEDLAISSGTQVFNYPISLDEGKWRDYIIATDMGFRVPATYLLPQSEFVRLVSSAPGEHNLNIQFELERAVNRIGGFPCFFKKAHGGGKVDVYKINSYDELVTFYMKSMGKLMILQQFVDYFQFIRTFVFGNSTIHCNYNIDLPDGQKYSWPNMLTEEDRDFLDNATKELARGLQTPFCTMETAKDRYGNWYFIDITNGCNFDMRECELGNDIYHHVTRTLAEELIEWTVNPRPIEVLGDIRQKTILMRQIARAELKGQNMHHLMEFAERRNITIGQDEYAREKDKFLQLFYEDSSF
jgi:hypothetical protein